MKNNYGTSVFLEGTFLALGSVIMRLQLAYGTFWPEEKP